MNNRSGKLIILLLVGMAFLLCSCGTMSRRPRKHVQLPYKRLVIVQFADQPPYSNEGDRFTKLLAEKILQEGADVDPVIVKPGEIGMESVTKLLRRGAIPVDVLRKAAKQCNADAIMIGKITHFNPYSDPSVGLNLKVFNVGDATLISSVTDRWNAASPEVRDGIHEYYDDYRDRSECRFGPNLMTTSPRYFLFFVAHTVVREKLGVTKEN